ncbi:MAG: heavy-metal-associated domain-containing protein [Phycisphaerales bacterium]|jgi:copper chaperone CopZ
MNRIHSFRLVSALFLMSAVLGACGTAQPTHLMANGSQETGVVHQVSNADKAAVHSTEPLAANSAVLFVNGLGCPLCASNIDQQLAGVKGVRSADVDLSGGTVKVTFAGPVHPSAHALNEAVEDAGFTLVKVQPQ